jgi:hypothetical protein
MTMALITGISKAPASLDTLNTIGEVLQHLPTDCYFNTRTGTCYNAQDEHGVTAYHHAYCKKLTCRTCAKNRKRLLWDSLCAQPFTHYLVLTLPGTVQPGDAEPRLKQALLRFLQQANRVLKPRKLRYYWSLGVGAGGRLHANLLLDTDFGSVKRYRKPRPRWVRDTWHRLTGAQQISLQRIQPGTLGNVVNYLLKDFFMTVLKCPGIKRREGSSRSVRLKQEKKTSGDGYKWVRLHRPTAYYARELGIHPDMPANGNFIVDPNAAPAAQSPTRGEPSLESRAAAGGHALPADGRAGVGTQGEALP